MAAHQDLFRQEFEELKIEKEREICFEIFNEIVETATADYRSSSESVGSCDSREADVLATQIVEQILNEIIEANFEFSSSSTEESSSSGSYDGDYSNFQSTSDADSTTDILANQVVQSILNEILERGLSSTTELTETQTSDTN